MLSIREKGYSGTRVDELCSAAGVTKGAFFHHFESKEALGLASIQHFGERAASIFAAAAYRRLENPRDRVLGYVDFRIALLSGPLPDVTCLDGTLIQEVYATHAALRDAAASHLEQAVHALAADLASAKQLYAPEARWEPESLARLVEATIQGAFVMAKAAQSTAVAADCLAQLRRHLATDLGVGARKEKSR